MIEAFIRRKFHQEKPPIQPNVSYPLEEIRNLYRITKRGIESGFMLNFTDRTAQDGRNSRSASGFQFIYDPEVEGVLVVFPEDKKELPRISSKDGEVVIEGQRYALLHQHESVVIEPKSQRRPEKQLVPIQPLNKYIIREFKK